MQNRAYNLLRNTVRRWLDDNTFRLGAALAYYTVFSIAPLALIVLSVAGAFFGKENARAEMLRQIKDAAGPQVGDAIQSVAQYTQQSEGGALATAIGLAVLLFAASSVFAQLQDALNTIWGVKSAANTTWLTTIKNRFWSFVIVLGIGFLLLASLAASAGLSALARYVDSSEVAGGARLWQGLNWLVSFGLIAVLFALIYRLLPDVEIDWSDVWVGAAATSLLFALGKYLISLYLSHSSWISAYGAAGSLVVVLLWVYYSSQIFLLGAEFTYVYANQTGKPLRPMRNAELVTEEARARQGMARRPAQEEGARSPRRRNSRPSHEGWPAFQRLMVYWERLRASYWFLPAVLMALAALLALAAVQLDESIRDRWLDKLGWVYTRGPDGARALLSTVAGSMITVAGVVFSVTIVALSLASNQFGPRLLRNFMRDRGNQVVLGTFVATFVYCLLVLRTVRGVDGDEFVPHLAVTVAILLALASLGVLIYFIHHVAVSIQAPELIARVAEDLQAAIDRLFPEQLGQEAERDGSTHDDELPSRCRHPPCVVASATGGYIQAIDGDQLMKLACRRDLVIRVNRRPGHFLVEGKPLALVWPVDRPDEELAALIQSAFLIGSQQTPTQDAEFAVDQLVQVAVRALSPGINDPFTAVTCIDRLGECLCRLAGRKLPSSLRRDQEGEVRVIANALTFAEMADAAFRQIRQSGRSHYVVLARLMDVIAETLADARRAADREALKQHARLTRQAAESLPEKDERQAIERRWEMITQTERRPRLRHGPTAAAAS